MVNIIVSITPQQDKCNSEVIESLKSKFFGYMNQILQKMNDVKEETSFDQVQYRASMYYIVQLGEIFAQISNYQDTNNKTIGGRVIETLGLHDIKNIATTMRNDYTHIVVNKDFDLKEAVESFITQSNHTITSAMDGTIKTITDIYVLQTQVNVISGDGGFLDKLLDDNLAINRNNFLYKKCADYTPNTQFFSCQNLNTDLANLHDKKMYDYTNFAKNIATILKQEKACDYDIMSKLSNYPEAERKKHSDKIVFNSIDKILEEKDFLRKVGVINDQGSFNSKIFDQMAQTEPIKADAVKQSLERSEEMLDRVIQVCKPKIIPKKIPNTQNINPIKNLKVSDPVSALIKNEIDPSPLRNCRQTRQKIVHESFCKDIKTIHQYFNKLGKKLCSVMPSLQSVDVKKEFSVMNQDIEKIIDTLKDNGVKGIDIQNKKNVLDQLNPSNSTNYNTNKSGPKL